MIAITHGIVECTEPVVSVSQLCVHLVSWQEMTFRCEQRPASAAAEISRFGISTSIRTSAIWRLSTLSSVRRLALDSCPSKSSLRHPARSSSMNESARRTRRLHRVVNGVSASAHSSDLPAVLLARPGLLLHMPPGRGGWPNQKAPHSGSLSPEKHSEFFFLWN